MEFTRRDDRVVWHTPAGTRRERPRRDRCEITPCPEASAGRGAGWIATAVITHDGRLVRYEVDATVGGEMERDGVFAFIDLDLDLEIDADGVIVKDLIEFAERRAAMGYPPGLLRRAVAALEEARSLHRARLWPFDGSLLAAGP